MTIAKDNYLGRRFLSALIELMVDSTHPSTSSGWIQDLAQSAILYKMRVKKQALSLSKGGCRSKKTSDTKFIAIKEVSAIILTSSGLIQDLAAQSTTIKDFILWKRFGGISPELVEGRMPVEEQQFYRHKRSIATILRQAQD